MDELDICSSVRFVFWLDHKCHDETHIDSFFLSFMHPDANATSTVHSMRSFAPKIEIVELGLYWDTATLQFQKRLTLINTGQVALDQFDFYIVGDDKMDLLSTNIGRMSANGDSLYFDAG